VFPLQQQFYAPFNPISYTNLHRICVPYGYNKLFHLAPVFFGTTIRGFPPAFEIAFQPNLPSEFLHGICAIL
jgi:hypothetical protein